MYLCFDSDEAGQKGAYIVADKLGFERCKNILLPEGQDLNDCLKCHSGEDFVAGKLDKHRQVDSGAKRIQEALVEKEKQRKKEE